MKKFIFLISSLCILNMGISVAQGCISGIIYSDENNNGQLDIGELGIVDQEVLLVASDGTTFSTLSIGEGTYELCDLADGDYYLYPNFITSSIFSHPSFYNISIVNGQSVTSMNFGLVNNDDLGLIRGQLFIDLNGNGSKDIFEPGVQNYPVTLTRVSPSVQAFVLNTNSSGEVIFSGLISGDYRLETEDMVPNATLVSPQLISLSLEPGAFLTNNKFVFAPLPNLGSIVDFVCLDIDANGINDPDSEPGISGGIVRLLNDSGEILGTTQSDLTGLYSFIGLPPGSYQVEPVFDPEDYVPTTPVLYELNVEPGGYTNESPFYFEPLRPKFSCGMAVHSYGQHPNSSNSISVWDTRDRSGAPIGTFWPSPPKPFNWTMSQTGPVFGLAIDKRLNIYATATRLYSTGNSYPAGTGGIIKIDGTTLAVSNLITTDPTSNGNPVNTSTLPNINAGLGNICYNRDHDLLYVTNLEDGSINVVNPITGNVMQRYDPFNPDDGISGIPTDRTELVWGIAYNRHEKRIYFGRNGDSVSNNEEVHSIGVIPGSGLIDVSQTPVLEFSITPLSSGALALSDIAFSDDEGSLLVSERGHPHRARVFLYTGTSGTWNLYQQMNVGTNTTDAAGGVDFGYESFSSPLTEPENCINYLYASSNALQFGGGIYTYGFAIAPPNIGPYSGYNFIDSDAGTSSFSGQKGYIGDVEVFDCQCATTNCDGLSVSSSSAGEAEGDCCWSLSFDNQQGEVYGISLTAQDGVALSYDPSSIAPGLLDVIFTNNSVTLVPAIGGP
ncbi:MAG: hypothetical protein KDC85_11760, partial [Saprospiraceae bacterium]|nr:hypothetical protein [Saprospiraceae bacterium]